MTILRSHLWIAALLASCTRAPPAPPTRLSDTGLYADIATQTIAPDVLPFQPAHELWTDGAEKRRWIKLPPGARVDTRDMDHWRFPAGTRIWKEFRRGGRLLETRYIERIGDRADDVFMGAFVWEAAGREAVFREEGADNVNGTDHDVPAARRCASCHGGEPGRVLGFSAVQLSGARARPGVDDLAKRGLLSDPPRAGIGPRGDAVTREALGYLHANCGHCHSRTGIAYREVDLVLRLAAAEQEMQEAAVFRSTVEVEMRRSGVAPSLRVDPGHPEQSGLITRMRATEATKRMPPLGTEHVDERGLGAVARWIASLPRER